MTGELSGPYRRVRLLTVPPSAMRVPRDADSTRGPGQPSERSRRRSLPGCHRAQRRGPSATTIVPPGKLTCPRRARPGSGGSRATETLQRPDGLDAGAGTDCSLPNPTFRALYAQSARSPSPPIAEPPREHVGRHRAVQACRPTPGDQPIPPRATRSVRREASEPRCQSRHPTIYYRLPYTPGVLSGPSTTRDGKRPGWGCFT